MGALKDHDIMKFVIIMMFIEHVIVLVKVYLEEYIEDVPKFVLKKAIKVQREIEKLGIDQKDKIIQDLEKEMKDKDNQFLIIA
jgi:hypothetical protein